MNQDEKSAILVVDDDPSVLESVSRLLSAFGYPVFPCGNATDAVAKLQETDNVRVVLTDISQVSPIVDEVSRESGIIGAKSRI
jgi:putative two-component system response regulator